MPSLETNARQGFFSRMFCRQLQFADDTVQTTAAAGGSGSDPSTELLDVDDFLNCPANTEFVNGWRGTATGSGSGITPLAAGVAGHPGVARLSTGTTTSGVATINKGQTSGGNNGSVLPDAANAITIDAVVRVPDLPSAGQQFTSSVGISRLLNLTSDTFAAQITWDGANPVWRLFTHINGGATTTVDAASGPTAGVFHHVQLVFTTALVTLSIDGTQVAQSSTNVPTLGGAPIIRQNKDGVGTTNRDLDVDLFRIQQTLPARLS